MPELSDFAVELVSLGVDAIVCTVIYQGFKHVKKTLKDVKTAPVLPYQALNNGVALAELVESHPDVVRELDTGESKLPYVILRGEVAPVKPDAGLSSQHSAVKDLKGVIQTFKLIEHKKHFSRSGFWYTSKRDIHTFVNEIPFGLVPTSDVKRSSSPLVEVADWRDASRLVLDTTYDHFREAPSSVGDHLLGWMTGDIQKGVQSTEQMLVNGTALTAIGELTLSASGDGLKMSAPSDGRSYFLTKSTYASLLKEIESEAKFLKRLLALFGGVGAALIGIAAFRWYRKWRAEAGNRETMEVLRQIQRDRNAEPAAAASAARRTGGGVADAGEEDTSTCRVCLQNPREIVLLECGHICLCSDCAVEIMRTRPQCPICRADIVRILPAYLS